MLRIKLLSHWNAAAGIVNDLGTVHNIDLKRGAVATMQSLVRFAPPLVEPLWSYLHWPLLTYFLLVSCGVKLLCAQCNCDLGCLSCVT